MKKNDKTSLIAIGGFVIAVVSGLAAVMAGIGTRYGTWNFRVGLAVLKWAAYGGVAAAVLSLIGFFVTVRMAARRRFILALLGLVIGVLLFVVPWHWMRLAKSLPPIHDITTDTGNPPKLVAALPLRNNASNPPDYGGPAIAEQQHRAYPYIGPLVLAVPPEEVFEKALSVARKMGWEIIAADKAAGRIEAVATTFWFGFKDDVVIRVERSGTGSRIDIRSVSRVGVSDIGTNAERVRKFLALMRKPSAGR